MKRFGIVLLTIFAIPVAVFAEAIEKECTKPNPEPRGFCFVADTLIDTPQGQKRIEDIKVGDTVVSFDFETQSRVEKTVTDTFAHYQRKSCLLELNDGTKMRVTPEHRFFRLSDEQIKAGNLALPDPSIVADAALTHLTNIGGAFSAVLGYSHIPGNGSTFDYLKNLGANPPETSLIRFVNQGIGDNIQSAKFPKIVSFSKPEKANVYNIEVEGLHNYFAEGVLVHNPK